MRCSQAQRLINDHIDNLLERRQVQKLEGHLQKCPRCRNLLIEMVSIVNEAKQLETIQPSEDLWPAIKEKIPGKDRKAIIRPQERRPLFGLIPYPAGLTFAVSALLAAIILVSLFYYGFPLIRNGENDPEKIALNHLKEAEQHYQFAIDALNRAISDQKAKLGPELTAVFKRNLEIIDDSIRACQEAINASPENRVANAYLLICYRKKLELLNEIKKYNDAIGLKQI